MLCGSDQFKCHDSKCIANDLVCNGVFDCVKGEDELECTKGLVSNDFMIVLYLSVIDFVYAFLMYGYQSRARMVTCTFQTIVLVIILYECSMASFHLQ